MTSCKWWNEVFLEPKWSRFFKVNPPKQGRISNQNSRVSWVPGICICYAFLWLLGKLFNSDQIAEVTPKRSSLVRECPPKSPENQLKEKTNCPDVGDEMQFLRSDWGFVRNKCHLLVTRYLEDHPISIYRGYKRSYPFIWPFEEVITPFLTRRGPPCILTTDPKIPIGHPRVVVDSSLCRCDWRFFSPTRVVFFSGKTVSIP